MNHFDEMSGLLYLEGELEPGHAREITAHARECAECGALLRALEREGHWLRASLIEEEESVPARLLGLPARSSAPWGWIAVLGFGAGGAYTFWSGLIEPWRAQAAQAGLTQGNLLTLLFFSGAFWKGWDAMRSAMEFLAMATLGFVVMWLLRRNWRRWTTVGVVLASMACLLGLPAPASAGEIRHGDPNYTLPAGETVHSDLFVFANSTHIDGTIEGDLIAFSDSLTVNGHVTGDIISFTGKLRVSGRVDGNIRTASHSFILDGTLGKNVLAWSGSIELDPKSQIEGTLTAGAGDMQLDGRIAHDVLAFGKTIEINGSLGGNARMRSEKLEIGSSASIAGHTKFKGRRQPTVSSQAKLSSPIEVEIVKRLPNYASPRYYWHQILAWGAAFLFGLVLTLLAPAFFLEVRRKCGNTAPALGFGILFLVATPVVAILVCITIVGLGVGIATLLLYAVAVYSAQVFFGTWLGEKILGERTGVGPTLGRLALGLAIVRILKLVPFLGGWFMLVVVVWGMGAIVLTLGKGLRPQVAATA